MTASVKERNVDYPIPSKNRIPIENQDELMLARYQFFQHAPWIADVFHILVDSSLEMVQPNGGSRWQGEDGRSTSRVMFVSCSTT
jgi:hypothetical protein